VRRTVRGGLQRAVVTTALLCLSAACTSAATSTTAITTAITSTATRAATLPVKAQFAASGPYATKTGTVRDASGTTIYDLYYPSNYARLGFKSPIITWGNGTNATPPMYSTLLDHFASYGFTVIASTLLNTGSGREIDAAAHYLIAQNAQAGSVFNDRLAVDRVAAVGHSQGAGGATRAATNDPTVIKTLMTFSLPDTKWVGANPDCPTAADCLFDPSRLTRPAFFISTHGPLDSIIAPPATETAFYTSVHAHAALGIISRSDGTVADHSTIQDTTHGGKPGGFLGYATAWLEYRLLGNTNAAAAFSGAHPQLAADGNWPGSAVK
jgi:pimeloyl-ACP methyl ester carboxylesterase